MRVIAVLCFLDFERGSRSREIESKDEFMGFGHRTSKEVGGC